MKHSDIESVIELRDPTLAKEALRKIDRLITSTTDSNERVYLLFSKSALCGIIGNFDEARDQLDLALQEQPGDPDTQFTVEFSGGLIYQQEGNYSDALKRFTAVQSRYAHRLQRPDLQYMYQDIQTRRAFLSVTLRQFKDAIPLHSL